MRSHIQDDTTSNQLESKLYKSRDSLDACCDMGGMYVYTYIFLKVPFEEPHVHDVISIQLLICTVFGDLP